MSKYKGFIVNGPHEGLSIQLEKYSEIVEVQFDETCTLFGYSEEDINNETYVRYTAIGPPPCPDEITYYVVDETQEKMLKLKETEIGRYTNDKDTSHSG